MNVGISIRAQHATASRAQTDNDAPPHNGAELGDQESRCRSGNAQYHNGGEARTAGWFADATSGNRQSCRGADQARARAGQRKSAAS